MTTNRILFLTLFLAFSLDMAAQDYVVEGATPDLHLVHSVAARETWYSIGRTYNLAPKDLAVYNKSAINTPLEIGAHIQVPLTAANFSQNEVKGAGETFVPVYHVVRPKEWLYRISQNHNKVPVENLEKWNSLTRDGAKPGMKLIVGYLKVKDANATLAPKTPLPADDKAAVAKPAAPVKKESPKPDDNAAGNEPVAAAAPASDNKTVSANKEGSYFKSGFEENGKSSSGVSGIFKSASGWQDGKYYALISNVAIGTIVKVSYPQTNKVIYAKVLGELPEMKESAGLALRISDAAAAELGATESKLSVDIKY